MKLWSIGGVFGKSIFTMGLGIARPGWATGSSSDGDRGANLHTLMGLRFLPSP
jgi:hypothetical protein